MTPQRRVQEPAGELWADDAACKDVDRDLFFPARGESTEPARAVCRTCPVQVECLAYAVRNKIHFGVWGGTSERERYRRRTGRTR